MPVPSLTDRYPYRHGRNLLRAATGGGQHRASVFRVGKVQRRVAEKGAASDVYFLSAESQFASNRLRCRHDCLRFVCLTRHGEDGCQPKGTGEESSIEFAAGKLVRSWGVAINESVDSQL